MQVVEKKKSGFKFQMPHTWVLLFSLIIIAALFTYVIPPGEYDRVDMNGRQVVDAATYHSVDPNHAGIFEILKAFPKGLEQAAAIVFFIFIVGGSFYVVQKSGAVDAGIAAAVRKTAGKGFLIVPLLSILFSFGGGIYGMAEEALPFIPALVMLCISLGYDSITGAAIALAATCAGFSGAFLNPFTIGVAQGIAQLPLFSGMQYRLVIFGITVAATVLFLARYCAAIKKNPEKSVMYEIDRKRDIKIDLANTEFTTRHKLILVTVLGTFVLLVFGVIKYGWYIQEICALFLGMAIISGIISKRGLNVLADDFIEGCAALAYGALIVGLARGILVIFTDAKVIDTIIYAMANWIQGFPASITSLGIYFVQILISFIVPSGSGMAALTMPVLSPLADVVGVTRQTAVLAYQFADGFSNILTPLQGYFMAGLALAGIPYQKWIRWIAPLAGIWFLLGGIFVVIATMINYGPF
ncbi:MAG: YfcC family protein [Pseudomonadota bacterium]